MTLLALGAVSRLAGGAVAGGKAIGAINKLKKIGVEQFGYDFFRLYLLLGLYFIMSLAIAKYFEWTIFSQGFLANIARLAGWKQLEITNDKQREFLVKFFQTGYTDLGFNYWDLIKFGAIGFVGMEWSNFTELKQVDPTHKPSMLTHSIFALTETFLTLITIPKFVEKSKELKNFI